MSRIAKAAVLTAAAGAALAGTAGIANADAGAAGGAANSPGVISGNNVQVPIHIPVNICGNTVDIIALLNPTAGNVCENNSTDVKMDKYDEGGHRYNDNGRHGNNDNGRHENNDNGRHHNNDDNGGRGTTSNRH
jgi:ChpA-C